MYSRILRVFVTAALLASSAAPALAYSDSTPPVVSAVSPITATTGVAATFSATYSDNGDDTMHGVTNCQLVEGPTILGVMTLSAYETAGTATLSYAFTTPGVHNVQAQCKDIVDNWGYGALTSITVGTPGTVSAVTPVTVVQNAATTFSATYSGFTAPYTAQDCWIVVDGSTVYPGGTLSGGAGSSSGTVTKSYTFTTVGSHTMFVTCQQNGTGTTWYQPGPTTSITVSAPDGTPPTVSGITPTSGTTSLTVYSATYSDNVAVTACDLMEGASLIGPMALGGGTATYSVALTAGTHNLNARCRDAAANWGTGAVTAVTVSGAPASDTTAPNTGDIFMNYDSPTAGTAVYFYVNANDNVGISSCRLLLDGVDNGVMTLAPSGSYQLVYTFPSSSVDTTHSAQARCYDAAGNSRLSAGTRYFHVLPSTTVTPTVGRLIKLVCPAYAAVDHPCKAVYYVGTDGKRHAFSNSKVYFTWYADFYAVQEVSDSTMASYALGRNVTYRPGIRMVKFTTVNTVYVVARGGLLRPVASEAIARALYGTTWNRQIDDISDAFYANYTFGASINNASDYSPSGETAAVTTVDANF